MMDTTSCRPETREANAEQYAAGRMTAEEAVAFEDHYVACAECQAAVRFASAVRQGVAEGPAAPPVTRVRHRAWATVGLLVAAAAIVGVSVVRLRSDPALMALGAVRTAPVYLGVEVRGANSSDAEFARAMEAYARGRYADAAEGMRTVLASGQDSLAAEFFRGASLMLGGRLDASREMFDAVLARGESQYSTEARYYRAKLLLRAGRGREALAELAHNASLGGTVGEASATLADSVRGILAR